MTPSPFTLELINRVTTNFLDESRSVALANFQAGQRISEMPIENLAGFIDSIRDSDAIARMKSNAQRSSGDDDMINMTVEECIALGIYLERARAKEAANANTN